MLVLPALHAYLTQLLSPPSIHTALLLTPEGALVSYATRHGSSPTGDASPPRSTQSNEGSSGSGTAQGSKPGSVASDETCTEPPPRTKDEIRMAAGLSAEVWAETREDGEGMAESELGRMLVVAVEDDKASGVDPLLLLAVNGTMEADWNAMRAKARKLASFLAPSVNKHRGMMGAGVVSAKGGRTRSTATSPGRGLNRW